MDEGAIRAICCQIVSVVLRTRGDKLQKPSRSILGNHLNRPQHSLFAMKSINQVHVIIPPSISLE